MNKFRSYKFDPSYLHDPTPLTEEGISDYLIQGKTGTILPKIVEEVKKRTS